MELPCAGIISLEPGTPVYLETGIPSYRYHRKSGRLRRLCLAHAQERKDLISNGFRVEDFFAFHYSLGVEL